MVLIYDRLNKDPRLKRLSHEGFAVWLAAIGTCNELGRDTIDIDELTAALFRDELDLVVLVDELAAAELVERLPHEHLRLLARLDLWAFDDDDVEW